MSNNKKLHIGHETYVESSPSSVADRSDRHEADRKPYILVQKNARRRSSLPTRAQELGGLHRSSPTGFRHVSKVSDEYLQQFAREYSDYHTGMPPLSSYLLAMRECNRCKAMTHPDMAVESSTNGEDTLFECIKCSEVTSAHTKQDDGLTQLYFL